MKSTRLIVDNHIFLKEIGFNEVEPIFETIVSEREYLGEWLPFVDKTTEIGYTRGFVTSYLDSDKKDLTLAIYFENKFAGLIGLKDTDIFNKKTEIGYWLSFKYQHKGIVTKACKTLIAYTFDVMELNRIQLKAGIENVKSRAIAESLGFQLEGIEREGELHARGYIDLAVYSLLKKEARV